MLYIAGMMDVLNAPTMPCGNIDPPQAMLGQGLVSVLELKTEHDKWHLCLGAHGTARPVLRCAGKIEFHHRSHLSSAKLLCSYRQAGERRVLIDGLERVGQIWLSTASPATQHAVLRKRAIWRKVALGPLFEMFWAGWCAWGLQA